MLGTANTASLADVAFLSVALYAALWITQLDFTSRRVPGIGLAAVLLAAVIAGSGALLGAVAGFQPHEVGAAIFGAGALVASVARCHFWNHPPIVAGGLVLSLWLSENFANPVRSATIPVTAALFVAATVLTRPAVVDFFGRGAVVYGAVVAAVLFAITSAVLPEGLARSAASAVVATLIAGAFTFTRARVFPTPAHSADVTVADARSPTFLALVALASAALLFLLPRVASTDLPLLLALLALLALLIYDASHQSSTLQGRVGGSTAAASPALGPFSHADQRARLIVVAAFAAVVLGLFARDASKTDGPQTLRVLLFFAGGYATALVLLRGVLRSVDSYDPDNAPSTRMGLLDTLAIIVYLGVPLVFLATYSDRARSVAGFLAETFTTHVLPVFPWQPVRGVLEHGFTLLARVPGLETIVTNAAAGSNLLVAVAAIALFAATHHVLFVFVESHALLAPIVSEVVHRGSPRARQFALTIEAPRAADVDPVLTTLRSFDLVATFFVDRTAVDELGSDHLRALVRAGHEVQCLGEPEPTSSHFERQRLIHAVRDAVGGVPDVPMPVWFRPSDGSRDVDVLRAANREGLAVALWNVCPWDWDAAALADAGVVRNRLQAFGGDLRGAIVRLVGRIPFGLQSPEAVRAGRAADATNLVENIAALGSLVRDTHPELRSVTLSDLCPHQGRGREV